MSGHNVHINAVVGGHLGNMHGNWPMSGCYFDLWCVKRESQLIHSLTRIASSCCRGLLNSSVAVLLPLFNFGWALRSRLDWDRNLLSTINWLWSPPSRITVQPWLSEPWLSKPSIIRTSCQARSAGQSTSIGYDIDMCMCSSVQCSLRLLWSCERQLGVLK